MSFGFNEVQEELRSTASRFLEDKSSSEQVRALMETESGYDEGTWKQIAELGWTGLAVPEEHGGAGFGFIELMVLLEEMGKRLLCAPFFSSVVLGANAIHLAATESQRKELLPGIADGTTRATLAFAEPAGSWDPEAVTLTARRDGGGWVLDGEKRYAIDGHTSNLLVVAARIAEEPGGLALFTVDPDSSGVQRTQMATLDLTRKQAAVTFSATPATLLGEEGAGADAFRRSLEVATALLCAEMIGGAQACLDMSVAFAGERVQFGRPIGSFQAVKHKCADMLIELENARSAAYYAGWAAQEDPEELPLAASLAKSYCSDACFHIAAETIQVHGGIGFTWEHDAHLYLRRAKSSEIYLGDGAYHRELVVQKLGV